MNRLLRLRRFGVLIVVARLTALPTRPAQFNRAAARRDCARRIVDGPCRRERWACALLKARLQKAHPRLCFSLSHTSDWAVLVGAQQRVGVDAESAREHLTLAMLRLITAHPREYAFAAQTSARGLDLWLAKEAAFKSAQNFNARFEPSEHSVRTERGWRTGLYFLTIAGLRIAVCKTYGARTFRRISKSVAENSLAP